MIESLSNINSATPISECIRCGTCCKKGGPSFHIEDKYLIEKGIILSKYLYTIRKGEPAYDNVKEHILPAATDIIKIKGKKGSLACIFFYKKNNNCRIYEKRPIECKVLKCWDTEEIEKLYSKNRLTRKDLLSKVNGLWDLIEDHHSHCSYEKIKRLVEIINKDKKNTLEGLKDIIWYDTHFRLLIAEKGKIEPEMVDFLFGRPLTETIKMFGFKELRLNDRR